VAWACALDNRQRPSALLLSRQNLPYAPKANFNGGDGPAVPAAIGLIACGGYVLAEPGEVGLQRPPRAVLIATGSEVQLALHAQQQLACRRHRRARRLDAVDDVFDRQRRAYQETVLPAGGAAHRGRDGRHRRLVKYGCAAVVGIDTFASRRRSVLFKHFGFTADNVADTVRRVLSQ
jgi:transketolase